MKLHSIKTETCLYSVKTFCCIYKKYSLTGIFLFPSDTSLGSSSRAANEDWQYGLAATSVF